MFIILNFKILNEVPHKIQIYIVRIHIFPQWKEHGIILTRLSHLLIPKIKDKKPFIYITIN